MNIAGAYPDSAGIKSWMRSISLIRDSYPCIEIKDNFQLERVTHDITLSLITPHTPQFEGTEGIVLQDENHHKVIIRYNGEMFVASINKIPLEDENMRAVWGDHLYRIRLKTITAVDQGECIIKK